MESIQFFFEKVKLEGKQNHLKMPPMTLLASGAGEPDYRILEEVPGQGGVEIKEITRAGMFNTLS